MTKDEEIGIEISAKVITSLIEDSFEAGITTLEESAQKNIKKISITTKNAYKKYLQAAIKKYGETKTIISPNEPVQLSDMFIDLDLKINRKIVSGNIDSIIEYGKPLVITGLAGSGKSTILKKMFIDSVAKKKVIPIYIELKNVKRKEENFIDYILELLGELNFNLNIEDFIWSLERGKYVFFFDGLDEVPPDFNDYIESEILSIRDKYHKVQIIVSSRPNEIFKSWQNFHIAKVEPLDKEKAINLIKKVNYDCDIKNNFVIELNNTLFEKHKSFLSNPLLLTIMLITYSQHADIPDKLSLFYQQAYEALFDKHDATKQGFKRIRHTDISIDQFQKIISGFSIQTYIENQYNFKKDEVIKYLENTKSIINVTDYDNNLVFKDLLKSLCILIQDGLLYTYTHRSFQEFFSALFISNLSNRDAQTKIIDQIKNKINRDNVLKLLYEIDKELVEDCFLIETISKIKNIYYDELKLQNLFIEIFSEINIDDGKFSKTVGNHEYVELWLFYLNVYSVDNKRKRLNYNDICNKILKALDKNDLTIKTKDLFKDENILGLLSEILDNEFDILEEILALPDKIIEERKNRQKAMDVLLNLE